MDAKELLKDLVAINTIADNNNHQIMDYIEGVLTAKDFRVERIANPRTDKQILIGTFGEDPAVGFLGHTDTVDITEGWNTYPFDLTEKDGSLYGLGACDMKGGIAAFLSAISSADLSSLKRGIKVFLTYDEEIMFEGIRDVLANNVDFAEHMVIAEPTDMYPSIASKGLLEYVFTFKGVTTHSSQPIEGKSSNKNAVQFLSRMMEFEQKLREHHTNHFEIPWPTMNVGIINGGTSINKVPDHTTIYLDFRICDSEREYPQIRKFVDDALSDYYEASYEIINDIPSFYSRGELTDFLEERTGKKSKAFSGITEASFFEGDRVILGPGPMTAHEANEHVSIQSLEDASRVYSELIDRLCR